jgi:hypothetical protein
VNGKIHRVDPDFGSNLTFSTIGILSQNAGPCNWKIMGRPCEFQVWNPACRPVRAFRRVRSGSCRRQRLRLGNQGASPGAGRQRWHQQRRRPRRRPLERPVRRHWVGAAALGRRTCSRAGPCSTRSGPGSPRAPRRPAAVRMSRKPGPPDQRSGQRRSRAWKVRLTGMTQNSQVDGPAV